MSSMAGLVSPITNAWSPDAAIGRKQLKIWVPGTKVSALCHAFTWLQYSFNYHEWSGEVSDLEAVVRDRTQTHGLNVQ